MQRNLDEKTHALGSFIVICRKCESLGRGSKTNLHVNYEKKYSMIICDVCNAMEVFNSQGERVTEKIEDKLDGKEEKLKN